MLALIRVLAAIAASLAAAPAAAPVPPLIFVGERRSRRARVLAVTLSDGRLAGRTLHDALRACGLDPTSVGYLNIFQDGDDGFDLDMTALAEVGNLAAAGAPIVALGQRVHRALARAQVLHLQLVHPAARGSIRARLCYQAHVAAVLSRSVPAPPTEARIH